MSLLKKLVMKLVTMAIMVALLGAGLRYARPLLMKSAGLPMGPPGASAAEAPRFNSDESDLMATVFKSAIRLLTGSASRKELAGELSAKLYAGRADAGTMSELGIELVQAGGPPGAGKPGAAAPKVDAPPGAAAAALAKSGVGKAGKATARPAESATDPSRRAMLARVWQKAVANPELALIPVVLGGMAGVRGIRRRRSPVDDLLAPALTNLLPSDSEPYDMTHAVHTLKSEDFELLVALIYQRQGYRVTMPAGLSGGRGGDFQLQRKAERVLVQCKNMRQDHKVAVERVKELQEAMTIAGVTRGIYVASCGFSWDARNFAKKHGVTVINARTLDQQISAARETPDENLLAVAQWAPKFMTKVKLTPPLCPTCEAPMDALTVSAGSVWVCSQRPDCRGRRSARHYQKLIPNATVIKEAV